MLILCVHLWFVWIQKGSNLKETYKLAINIVQDKNNRKLRHIKGTRSDPNWCRLRVVTLFK